MGRCPSFQFYPADFMSGTALLSRAVVGAYISMLCAAWETGPIPDTPMALFKAMGLGPDDPPFEQIWPALRPKWTLVEGGWINPRLERVREERDRFIEKQRANGKLGGRPRKSPGFPDLKARGFEKQKPDESQKKPLRSSIFGLQSSDPDSTKDHRADALVGFERFWTIYPKRKARARAERAWRKLRASADLVERIEAAVVRDMKSAAWRKDGGAFIPHPATWLNDRRWEDETCHTASERDSVEYDWWTECKRLHGNRCNGQYQHAQQLAIDADRAAKESA